MKVILLSDIYKHGVAGEVITVADGFARNYLIPKNLAVKADPVELKKARRLREQAEARRASYENKLNELARQIDGVELIFGRRAASTGTLFGSVTTQQIADALMEKTGVDINRRRISQQPLREIGTHEVPIRLGSDEAPVLKVTVVREEELAEFLAAREVAEAGSEAAEEIIEAMLDPRAETPSASEIRQVLAAAQAEADAPASESAAAVETEAEPAGGEAGMDVAAQTEAGDDARETA